MGDMSFLRRRSATPAGPDFDVLAMDPGDWPEDATPLVHHTPVRTTGDLTAALAHAVIAFLAGPDRDRLRACHAPRCVRYFLKEHPRQEWCKPSCGNRARVARHHQRHKATV